MRSLATDTNNDITLGADKNLALVSGVAAIEQNCKTAIQALQNEMMYAMQSGMPMFETAWNTFNPYQFEAAARNVLTGVQGVLSVQSFSLSSAGGTLSYAAQINTTFGPLTVNS